MGQVYREGFTALAVGHSSNEPIINVIFVHGLTGHPRETWEAVPVTSEGQNDSPAKYNRGFGSQFWALINSLSANTVETEASASTKVFWPEMLLAPDIPEARLWTYGYNADIISIFQANNKNSVSQHGRDLAVKLERDIENEDPIVFVAHSLGGIIVKDAMHKSKACRDRTKLIIFLGTPHRGSGYAGWGQIASNLARVALQDSNTKILEALEVNGEVLDNIHEEFKSIVHEGGMEIHSFQEARGIAAIKGFGKVVDDLSSKLDLPRALETVESLDANHIQMAKCKSREDPNYRAIIGVLKRFLRGEAERRKTAASDSLLKSLFMVPFPRDRHFVGREDVIEHISRGLGQTVPQVHKRVALVGLGGVGKSQIAIEYAYKVGATTPLFWIHASNASRFEQGYRELANKANISLGSDPQANILELVKDWLCDERNGRWLLVLDNVDDSTLFFNHGEDIKGGTQAGETRVRKPLESFLPQSPNGSILITSRNSQAVVNLVGAENLIPVEPMDEKDALSLLEAKVPAGKSSDTEARALVRALEFIPLAITQAAAYISVRKRITVSTYLELFRKSEENQMNLLDGEDTKNDIRRDYSIRQPVATAWRISFEQIRQTNAAAIDMLALMSMFDRQGIPEDLLTKGMDRLHFEEAVAPLLNFSFIRTQVGQQSFEMHRLIQISTRRWLQLYNELGKWIKTSMEIMAEAFPSGDYETWTVCEVLLPHSKEVVGHQPGSEEEDLHRATIASNTGRYLLHKGKYEEAKEMHEQAFKTREKALGPEHPDTLHSVNNLGDVLYSQGNYEEAEKKHRQALKVREKILGPEHPDTLHSVNNLGNVLYSQGKFEETETMYRQALKTRGKVLGPEHQDTLRSVNNLAIVLYSHGKYKEAETMYRQALKAQDKVLGPEHPDTLVGMNNLGLVLYSQGKYEEAETTHRQALKAREKVLGPEHPDTLHSVSNLANALYNQGKYEEVEAMHRQAIKAREKVLGLEHPDTLHSINNLGGVLYSQGKFKEAEAMHQKVLKAREKMLGPEHPDTLYSVDNLGLALRNQGKYEEAETMHRQAIKAREKVLGPEHPDTLQSVNNLGRALYVQGKYGEAEAMHRQAIKAREKVLGSEHPDTLQSVNDLGRALSAQHR